MEEEKGGSLKLDYVEKRAISQVGIYLLMIGMLVTGSLNTILTKEQDIVVVGPQPGEQYNHPYFQCATMFLGELLCLGAYGIIYWRERKQFERTGVMSPLQEAQFNTKQKVNPLLFAIPAAFDTCGSTLLNIALIMVAASVYQMMRGFVVVVTVLFSILFLRRRFYRQHALSVFLIVLGIVLVGLAAVLQASSQNASNKSNPVGFIFIIAAQLFAGGQFIIEEKLLGKYVIHPLKVVGWEGLWGCVYWAILLPIFQFIPCGGTMCPSGHLEDTPQAFQQMGDHPSIIGYTIGSILSIAFFNGFGVSVTKYASAAARSTIDISRTVIIWVFFLVVPPTQSFSWLQLVGFIIVTSGTLIFNEIVVLPFLGFNENTKKAIATRVAEEEFMQGTMGISLQPAADYMAISPMSYDYQKQKKKLTESLVSDQGPQV